MATLTIDTFSPTSLAQPMWSSALTNFPGSELHGSNFLDTGLDTSQVVGGRRTIAPVFCAPIIATGKLALTKNAWTELALDYYLASDRNIQSIELEFGTLATPMSYCLTLADYSSRSLKASSYIGTATSGGTPSIAAGSFSGAATLSAVRFFQFRLLFDAATAGTFELLTISATIP